MIQPKENKKSKKILRNCFWHLSTKLTGAITGPEGLVRRIKKKKSKPIKYNMVQFNYLISH
jgi:DNA/RNA-binding domain of Phe-tRNA-synthetase-like protein